MVTAIARYEVREKGLDAVVAELEAMAAVYRGDKATFHRFGRARKGKNRNS